ncbi:MAG: VWA domain-containing protein [Odoribacter sp.]|nr:VWA domain-containing protein [Odoribacter sp.]
MQLAHPHILWLLVLLIPLTVWYILRQRDAQPTLAMSSTSPFARMPRTWKSYLRHFMFVLRLAAIACVIVVLARPQLRDKWSTSSTEGTDIVIALDISSSMYAKDFEPNRFEAAKAVASRFIQGRENDNIGLVIFAGESLTGMPMTGDRVQLINYLNNLSIGDLEDGTAIGEGILTSLNRLRDGKAKSKSIILITDGTNNRGLATPGEAARAAAEMGVKIYSIGVGTNGMALVPVSFDYANRPVYERQKVEINEDALRDVASVTGGRYFRATDNNSLDEVFAEIDALEKTKLDVKNFSHTEDHYLLWAWLAFGFFALEMLLRYVYLRPIP